MNIRIIILFLFFTSIFSCISIEDPSMTGVTNVKIISADQKRLEIEAVMTFQNPNNFALDLDKAKIKAVYEEKELAEIDQSYETSMPANNEFEMPFHIILDLTKIYDNKPLGAISHGLKILSERKIEVLFQGAIYVGKKGAMVKVPINRREEIIF